MQGCLVITDLGLLRTKARELRVHWERKKRLAGQMWPAIPRKAKLGFLRNLHVRTMFFSLCPS